MSVTKFILQTDRITTCALQSARRSGSRFGSLIVSTTRPCFKENRGRVFLCGGQPWRSHTLIFHTALTTGSREADQGQAAELSLAGPVLLIASCFGFNCTTAIDSCH